MMKCGTPCFILTRIQESSGPYQPQLCSNINYLSFEYFKKGYVNLQKKFLLFIQGFQYIFKVYFKFVLVFNSVLLLLPGT